MDLNKEKDIVIISHFSFKDKEEGAVFPQNIRNYLINKKVKVRYIDHPFPDANFHSSQLRIYGYGSKLYELTTPWFKPPTLPLFIYQFFLTFILLIVKPVKYDLCIACDNLSFLSALLLRKIGIIKEIIYYTVDYSPKRYTNSILNFLYQNLDRLANRWSDLNWVAVEDMITAKEQNGLNLKRCAPFQVVPIGFDKEEINLKSGDKNKRFNLVFVGVLIEKQGLQLAIEALPILLKRFSKITLTVIGSGSYEVQIKKMVKEKKLSDNVKFTGYISSHKEIVKILNHSGIGLALYDPSIGDYTYFADPSKIKIYLLSGLPVIITQVPPIAKEIKRKKAGFVVDYSQKDFINAIESLLQSDKRYLDFRKNALRMSENFENKNILDKAFKKI